MRPDELEVSYRYCGREPLIGRTHDARTPMFASRERRGPPAASLGVTLIAMYQLREPLSRAF